MAAATGIVMNHRFTYRGDTNEYYSNKYWLTGAPPTTSADWEQLFNQMQLACIKIIPPNVHIVGAYGYDDNTDGAHSVWSIDLEAQGGETPGTMLPDPSTPMAGDQAGMIEWKTERKNSRGKWIYLRKYIHKGGLNISDPDRLSVACLAAYDAFGEAFLDGTNETGRKLRSQKQDEVLQEAHASEFVTTRTLKRRGKRP